MISKLFINRLIIIGFMIAVGFCLARGIQAKSITGFLLAIVSLGAGVYFVYLQGRAKADMEAEETA